MKQDNVDNESNKYMTASKAQKTLGIGRTTFDALKKNVTRYRPNKRDLYLLEDLRIGLEKTKIEPCTLRTPENTNRQRSRRTRTDITRASQSTESLFESALARLT